MDALILVLLRSFVLVFGGGILVIVIVVTAVRFMDTKKQAKDNSKKILEDVEIARKMQEKLNDPNCSKEFICPRCRAKVYFGEDKCANCGQELDWTTKN